MNRSTQSGADIGFDEGDMALSADRNR